MKTAPEFLEVFFWLWDINAMILCFLTVAARKLQMIYRLLRLAESYR
ncbi:hypothetical protein SAMN04488129_1209 [Halomonas daqiaonensis]|uniref:Uncharacterized protein n=1 Tax=Halomonas daqiaonensis TaxID=650850 RepID=A0A1H7UBU5_9GAMM|nr:hypothetical protein SAMN04488129_1209 [Halomonas daqiaonensis]